MEMSTPTKISARNPVCKLCGGCYESPYMLRIFSKAGLSQNLYSKLYKISGITISEDDNVFSAMLYNVGPHTQLVALFFAGRIVIYRSKIIRMKCSLN